MKKQEWVCSEKCPHIENIEQAIKTEPSQEHMKDLANVFKLLADHTRLRIICAILNNELCVCDLCELLGLTQSNASHQLQLLRTAKLVKYRKEGKQVYYSLQDAHIEAIIRMGIEHMKEEI